MNWEKVIEKPIPLFRAEPTPHISMRQVRKEEITRDSAAFRAKIEADLKRAMENHGKSTNNTTSNEGLRKVRK